MTREREHQLHGHKPRARHTHARLPKLPPRELRQPLPVMTLHGGPLAGCEARIPVGALDHGTWQVPSSAGRYVRTDITDWNWEDDHHAN